MNRDVIIALAFLLCVPPLSYYSVYFGHRLGDKISEWLRWRP